MSFSPTRLRFAAKVPPCFIAALAHRMAGHAAARFEGFLALFRIARRLMRQIARHAGLPDERGDGLDFAVVQAESGHLGAGTPHVRILEPDRQPLLVHLHAHFFEAGPDLLDLAHQAARTVVILFDLGVQQLMRTFRSLAC